MNYFLFFPELPDALRTARSQEIRIPFGVGVAGVAAQTKHHINLKNAYADPRCVQQFLCLHYTYSLFLSSSYSFLQAFIYLAV